MLQPILPPQGGKAITTPLSELENIVMALHRPYDSIKEHYVTIPIKLNGDDNSSVTVSFKEDRFYKDGTEESLRIIDRDFINSEENLQNTSMDEKLKWR